MSDLELLQLLFYKKEGLDIKVYTLLTSLLYRNIPVKLGFSDEGVYLTFKGQEDNFLLYSGEFQIQLGGKGDDNKDNNG